jgi:hypothetical protein
MGRDKPDLTKIKSNNSIQFHAQNYNSIGNKSLSMILQPKLFNYRTIVVQNPATAEIFTEDNMIKILKA